MFDYLKISVSVSPSELAKKPKVNKEFSSPLTAKCQKVLGQRPLAILIFHLFHLFFDRTVFKIDIWYYNLWPDAIVFAKVITVCNITGPSFV